MDKDAELRHLAMADHHIADAQARIAALRARFEPKGAVGISDTTGRLLSAMEDNLAAMEHHRMLILQAIADIEGGTL